MVSGATTIGTGCEWYDLCGIAPLDQPNHSWQQISEFNSNLQQVNEYGDVQQRTCYLRTGATQHWIVSLSTLTSARTLMPNRCTEP